MSHSMEDKGLRIGLLFDLDGTLALTDHLHFEIFRDLLVKEGFAGGQPITKEFYQRNISGGSNDEILTRLFPGFTPQQRLEWAAFKEAYFREQTVGKLSPVPGLEAFMAAFPPQGLWARRATCLPAESPDRVRVEVVKVLVTNAPPANCTHMLHELGLTGTFQDQVVVDLVGCRGKPDPEPYQLAMTRSSLTPAHCVAFEDSCTGVRSAHRAGVGAVVGLCTTHTPIQLKEAGATTLVDDWRGLLSAGAGVAYRSQMAALLGLEALWAE
ncbi:putative HAD family phosphatase [Paratrimastix pyriformis]|uniref:HAD family phosphatase n=1 Tax=Paratrimastix pyriformis TaxID=342808 RepID=A0ABQ8UIN1_9EUKA|nr:putative HAD family phosphatase [Paratrimastix pyriformis]